MVVVNIETKRIVRRQVEVEANIADLLHVGDEEIVHPVLRYVGQLVPMHDVVRRQFAVLEGHAIGQQPIEKIESVPLDLQLRAVSREPPVKLCQQAYSWIHALISSNVRNPLAAQAAGARFCEGDGRIWAG